MRTFAIVFAIIALAFLVAILIAPNVDLDDYCDRPFFHLVLLLLSLLLQLSSLCNSLLLPDIASRTRRAHTERVRWPRCSSAATATLPLLC